MNAQVKHNAFRYECISLSVAYDSYFCSTNFHWFDSDLRLNYLIVLHKLLVATPSQFLCCCNTLPYLFKFKFESILIIIQLKF